jgi:hypothetical protein
MCVALWSFLPFRGAEAEQHTAIVVHDRTLVADGFSIMRAAALEASKSAFTSSGSFLNVVQRD